MCGGDVMDTGQFWNAQTVVLQDSDRWQVLRWPTMAVLAHGDGEAIPEPGGHRLAVRDREGQLHIVDGDESRHLRLPADAHPIRAIAWDGGDALMVVAGKTALNPPYAHGPSLLPVPPTGCTAQSFGSIPALGLRLWRFPLAGGKPTVLVQVNGIETIGRPVSLFGGRVAFTFSTTPAYGRSYTQRVRYWDPSLGQDASGKDLFPELTGATTECVPSPDGHHLAFLHSDIELAFPFWYRLVVADAEPGSPMRYPLPPSVRLGGRAPVWSPDGHFVAVTAFQGIRVGIVVVNVESGAWDWLGLTDGVYSRVALAPGGHEVIASWESPTHPRRLYRVSASKRTLLSESMETAAATGLARGSDVRLVPWRNGDVELEGVLVIPEGAGPHPLVVDLHGGPLGWPGFGQQPNLAQWCRAGFAAFAPDYRASGIAGKEAMLASLRCDDTPPGLSSVEDVLAGVETVVGLGVADPERLFLFGHSAGGQVVNRIVTVDHRFRAAACWEGYSDPRVAYFLAGGGGGLDYGRTMFGGNPWQAPEKYRADSALAYVADVRTPVLLLYGDHRGAPFPLVDAIIWYTALREHGVDAELVIYRDEGHLLGRSENRADLFARAIAWFTVH